MTETEAIIESVPEGQLELEELVEAIIVDLRELYLRVAALEAARKDG